MSRQHANMAELYTLAQESIETIQNIVNGQSETPLQLNCAQCKILAQELAELSVYLQGTYDKLKVGQDVRQIALLHLYSVIKRAELLVGKCCCKKVESWLLEAITLVEIQEDFAAIILDLHQWRMTMDVTIAVVMGASRDSIEELLMTMDEEYQELYKKLRRSNHALQQGAVEDRKEIVLKLAEVQESEDRLGYLCALHLQSWLAELDDGIHFTNSNVIQKLIKHEKGSFLGMGGCGAVHRVKWLGVQCALKMLNVKDQREATVLKGLLHPNIVRLYLYWDDLSEIETPNEGDGYNTKFSDGTDGFEIEPPIPKSNLLMELMDTDLSKYIKSRLERMAQQSGKGEVMMPFSLPVAIDIMLQVGQALQYMHDKHLTHRDLKTANILVRRVNKALTSFYSEGYLEIKLADFGLAKAYENTSTSQRHSINVGTTRYGAPEVFEKDLATERNFPPMADVWSFGVTCSEILSGIAPYENENPRTLHTRIVKGNLRPSLPKLCPEYLAFIIRGCWELQPKRRPDFTSICRMLRHAKLLSLGITKLDDSRPFLRYMTRRGFVQTLHNPRALKLGIPRRLFSFLRTPFQNVKIPSIGEVQTSAMDDPVQSETAREKQQPRNGLVFIDNKEYSFDLEDLLRASAEVLGKGSVGTTYKAQLVDQPIMAIKRLRFGVATDILAFKSQIELIGKFQHADLLPLRAYYCSKDDKLLVYDYIGLGSLHYVLHGNQGSSHIHLDWAARMWIATGAARGLAYLHTQGGPKFVHSNIKSSNILVSRDLNACISDCGLAQLLTSPSAQSEIIGYQAPEVTELRKATQKSDVYSFGVLLLELLTGKAPTQAALNDEGIDLPRWVQSIIREDWTIKVFDAELLRYNAVEGEMVNSLQIAMRCVDPVPERRPTMSEVQLLIEDVRSPSP